MLGDLRDLLRGRVSDDEFQFSRHYAPKPVEVSYSERPWPIHYLTLGNPNDPTIFLFHGVGSRAGQYFEFTHIMQSLVTRGFYCVAADLPGHGRTRAPTENEDFRLENLAGVLADFTRKIMDASQSSACVWVTHSLSTAAATLWLANRSCDGANTPPKLKGIYAMSLPAATSVPLLLVGTQVPGAHEILPTLLYRFGRPYYRVYIQATAVSPQLRRGLIRLYYPVSQEAVRAQMGFIKENTPLLLDPGKIVSVFQRSEPIVPIEFIHGSSDALFPAELVRKIVEENMPGVPFTVLARAGHNVPDDIPEEIVHRVTRFAILCFAR